MDKARLLLVEDDHRYGTLLGNNLRLEGYQVTLAPDADEAEKLLSKEAYDLVVSDIRMPGRDGIELLTAIRQGEITGVESHLPVIMLTSIHSVETAVEATRKGADDYVLKDWGRQEISLRIEKTLAQHHLRREHGLFREMLTAQAGHGEIIAVSHAMHEVLRQAQQIAVTGATVLITGETGVGKELIAQALHTMSPRGKRPFLAVNCAALPEEDAFQSELFGHERAALGSEGRLKPGKFESAQGGTIFLDEICELSLDSQAKLLRVMENREFERLGGTRKLHADVRFLLATNRDLSGEVSAGRFRSDLYYRVNVAAIHIPPLRQRQADIMPLAEYFLQTFAQQYRRSFRQFSPEAVEALTSAQWPGNVRELRNTIERLLIRGGQGPIARTELFPEQMSAADHQLNFPLVQMPPEGAPLEEIERQAVLLALERCNYNQTRAAALLRISPDRMNARVKKFKISTMTGRNTDD